MHSEERQVPEQAQGKAKSVSSGSFWAQTNSEAKCRQQLRVSKEGGVNPGTMQCSQRKDITLFRAAQLENQCWRPVTMQGRGLQLSEE